MAMYTQHFAFDDNDQRVVETAVDAGFVRNLFRNSGQLPMLLVPVGARYYSCLELIDRGWTLDMVERQALNHIAR